MLALIFSALSYKITFVSASLLNAILLQKFRNIMKISPSVSPVSPAEYLKISKKKIYFIGNNKHSSDNNVNNECGIRQCDKDGVNERLTERSKYYESDKKIWF